MSNKIVDPFSSDVSVNETFRRIDMICHDKRTFWHDIVSLELESLLDLHVRSVRSELSRFVTRYSALSAYSIVVSIVLLVDYILNKHLFGLIVTVSLFVFSGAMVQLSRRFVSKRAKIDSLEKELRYLSNRTSDSLLLTDKEFEALFSSLSLAVTIISSVTDQIVLINAQIALVQKYTSTYKFWCSKYKHENINQGELSA